MPLDTHIQQLSDLLKLRSGGVKRSANLKMAIEITDSFRCMSPHDPVRYDFALTRLGILRHCKKKRVDAICVKCSVETFCRFGYNKKKS